MDVVKIGTDLGNDMISHNWIIRKVLLANHLNIDVP